MVNEDENKLEIANDRWNILHLTRDTKRDHIHALEIYKQSRLDNECLKNADHRVEDRKASERSL